MPLYSWIRELVEKYTFIKRTKFEGMYFYIYYDKDDKELHRRIPFRASKDQLLMIINKIKKDINYHSKKQDRDYTVLASTKKPMIFVNIEDDNNEKRN